MNNRMDFESFPVSALEKVLPSARPMLYENEGTAFCNERYSFQIAYRRVQLSMHRVSVTVEGDCKDCVHIRYVENVPCSTPGNEDSDDYLLAQTPQLIPDLLREKNSCDIVCRTSLWQALWVTVKDAPAGVHTLRFVFRDFADEVISTVVYTLTVLPHKLPKSDILYTNWVHYDALAKRYHLPVFTKEYYDILSAYIEKAVEHGMTMLLTPIFTPALDTEIGKERLTAQLVDVYVEGNGYRFEFERLGQFISFAQEKGIAYFEIAHLFTQWGAKFAPKIMGIKEGKEVKLFGWETPSLSEEYVGFLSQFLPALREYLLSLGIYKNCYFHISDEPNETMLDNYRKCREVFKKYVPDGIIVDALSHYEFYEQGIVDLPFVATDCAQNFIDHKVKDYFVYFCTAQKNQFVSNRFIAMPSERTRIIGMQLYINGVRGLLQWGYNYYYSFLSKEFINPYQTTDCLGVYQSGDSFIVYPTERGADDSIRHELTSQAFEDYRALKLLESHVGREKVVEFLIENGLQQNFTGYEHSALWLSSLRKKINAWIAQF